LNKQLRQGMRFKKNAVAI